MIMGSPKQQKKRIANFDIKSTCSIRGDWIHINILTVFLCVLNITENIGGGCGVWGPFLKLMWITLNTESDTETVYVMTAQTVRLGLVGME